MLKIALNCLVSSKIVDIKILINANLKELDDDNVTIFGLIVTLNLTDKGFALDVGGKSYLADGISQKLDLTNFFSHTTELIA